MGDYKNNAVATLMQGVATASGSICICLIFVSNVRWIVLSLVFDNATCTNVAAAVICLAGV